MKSPNLQDDERGGSGSPASAIEIASMTPQDYLQFLKQRATQDQLKRFQVSDKLTGLRTELVNGVPYGRIEDEATYRNFLRTSRHLSNDEVDRILEKEKEVEQFFLAGVEDASTRLREAGEFSRNCLLPEDKPRLDAVPIGVAPLSYFKAGASPVPSGGDVIVLSVSLSFILYWDAWIKILRNQSLKSQAEGRRLLASLPDLARHVLGGSPATGRLMYHVLSAAESAEFKDERVNRIRWLVEVFVILHEYGHIIKGHTESMRGWKEESALTENELLERRRRQREWEFEADDFAAKAMQSVVYTPPLDPDSLHDEILDAFNHLFLLFHFAESESQVLPEDSTHPPAVDRWRRILRAYLDDHEGAMTPVDQIVDMGLILYELSREVRLQDQ
jgi:hypothetical protein